MNQQTPTALPTRRLQVDRSTGKRPITVDRLRDWEYLERQMHRLICAWARFFPEWRDKAAVHRHVWEQSECVRRLRERLVQFPGNEGNLDLPVSRKLEDLADAVLTAPTHQDAVDGIYQLLNNALTRAYMDYACSAHPIHDAPTVAALTEVATIKEGMRLWLRDFRRRYPHTTDAAYRAKVESALAACKHLHDALPVGDTPAGPCGLRTGFRLPRWPARPAGSAPKHRFRPFLEADFDESVEARRLWWSYGYMLEMNLAMEQVAWLYDSQFMPWLFHQDVSRHLWDESRHGDSGMSRLLDFGIALGDVGFASYDPAEPFTGRAPLLPHADDSAPDAVPAAEAAAPLTPRELYERVFHIGMLAETGHFQVKREAYDDFKAGDDLESAEMMLFDIIDEQTHVQYAHRWLPLLAEHAGIENTGYRDRAASERKRLTAEHSKTVAEWKRLPRSTEDPAYALYQRLLATMREKHPLTNRETCPKRSMPPM